jgi:hypothetical protein
MNRGQIVAEAAHTATPYPALGRFVEVFAAKPSARHAPYRFDPPASG